MSGAPTWGEADSYAVLFIGKKQQCQRTTSGGVLESHGAMAASAARPEHTSSGAGAGSSRGRWKKRV